MHTLVVGDIHGCYREFNMLLDKAGLSRTDHIVTLGDMVDRGPATLQVIEFFRDHKSASALLGNHERKHLRWTSGESRPTPSQRITRIRLGDSYLDALNYMRTLPLSMNHEDALLVHGCLEPGIRLNEQWDSVLTGATSGEQYLRYNYEQPWYEIYKGRKPVIVGHNDFLRTGKPFIYKDKIFGIDTSCVRGGWLTGIVLPEWRIVQVKARADYWSREQVKFMAWHGD